MTPIITATILGTSSLPHIELARFLEKDQPVVEREIGQGIKTKKGPGYQFLIKGFTEFWLLGYGRDMTRLICHFGEACTREQALGCLGLSESQASVRQLSLGNAAIATRRNCVEITGVKGLPTDRYTHKPWKVEYEEEGFINRTRMDELRSRIDASTGPARIQLIRQCYDWRPKISILQ